MTTIAALHPSDDLSLESAFNHPVLSRYDAPTTAADELISELGIEPPQETEFKSLVVQIFEQSRNVDRALDALWEVVERVSADVAAENDD